jgi:hypothetical protein
MELTEDILIEKFDLTLPSGVKFSKLTNTFILVDYHTISLFFMLRKDNVITVDCMCNNEYVTPTFLPHINVTTDMKNNYLVKYWNTYIDKFSRLQILKQKLNF